jgi:hypothetical protein
MPSLYQLLSNPIYAAIIVAIVTFLVSYINNRLFGYDESVFSYIKSMLYCSGIVYLVVYIVTNPRGMGSTSAIMY